MKPFIKHIIFVFAVILLTSNCAKKGRPNGGLKDSLAPVMVTANPPYKSIHFNSKKIKLSFDEYITLKNVNQQLVISPPLKYFPTISPQGSPSKEITIKLTDTLKENTTYIFNFGNSIEDNNEGNVLKSFNYVFSTGNYVDSLKTKGFIKDAFNNKFDKDISILLYEVDSTYSDSIIYKQKPNYITNALDSLFKITNIKEGKYLLVALKDVSNNYTFNPKEDKIGFYNRFIELPNDSILEEPLSLFKETPTFKIISAKETSKGKIIFDFEGERENIDISVLSDVSSDFNSKSRLDNTKDSLYLWHSKIDTDSLVFKVKKENYIDTLTVFLRKKVLDSLKINSNITRTLDLKDTLTLKSNNPVIKIDTSKIAFFDQDSVAVIYQHILKKSTNKIQFLFDKKYNTNYKLTLLPKALTDIFETQNDTLNYNFNTKEPEDYGSISLTLNKKPLSSVIVELLSEKDKKVIQRTYVTDTKNIKFELLPPGNYIIRAILDTNSNKKWDTGNYLKKKEPEKVIYLPITFSIKANWNFSEIFTIN
ncbi:Ig-like domain-containing protein [Polaribacter gochangensis]|uniref:Ig-like domain-containing protein n=1 Tax=Polaribacter gochangensis TaxID=3252903 RepID=UPI0039048C5F